MTTPLSFLNTTGGSHTSTHKRTGICLDRFCSAVMIHEQGRTTTTQSPNVTQEMCKNSKTRWRQWTFHRSLQLHEIKNYVTRSTLLVIVDLSEQLMWSIIIVHGSIQGWLCFVNYITAETAPKWKLEVFQPHVLMNTVFLPAIAWSHPVFPLEIKLCNSQENMVSPE